MCIILYCELFMHNKLRIIQSKLYAMKKTLPVYKNVKYDSIHWYMNTAANCTHL